MSHLRELAAACRFVGFLALYVGLFVRKKAVPDKSFPNELSGLRP